MTFLGLCLWRVLDLEFQLSLWLIRSYFVSSHTHLEKTCAADKIEAKHVQLSGDRRGKVGTLYLAVVTGLRSHSPFPTPCRAMQRYLERPGYALV